MTTNLEIATTQNYWNNQQLAALKQIGAPNAPQSELEIFFHQAKRTGLDPFSHQIYLVQRKGAWTIQTGIDGFRVIARRATTQTGGTLGYLDTQWCGQDGQWQDVWLKPTPPAAAKTTIVRDGQNFSAVALFTEYAAYKTNGDLNQFWKTKPALMLAKCAEALALRKAFPQDLAGLYTSDEMAQADNPTRTNNRATATRDWTTEINHVNNLDELRTLWSTVETSGEMTNTLKTVFTTRATQLQQQPEPVMETIKPRLMQETPDKPVICEDTQNHDVEINTDGGFFNEQEF